LQGFLKIGRDCKLFGSKVKLDKNLLEDCKKQAEEAGYSSVEEFITHVLEKELKNAKSKQEEDKEVVKKLRGLGYIE